jgi:hypothetical protein
MLALVPGLRDTHRDLPWWPLVPGGDFIQPVLKSEWVSSSAMSLISFSSLSPSSRSGGRGCRRPYEDRSRGNHPERVVRNGKRPECTWWSCRRPRTQVSRRAHAHALIDCIAPLFAGHPWIWWSVKLWFDYRSFADSICTPMEMFAHSISCSKRIVFYHGELWSNYGAKCSLWFWFLEWISISLLDWMHVYHFISLWKKLRILVKKKGKKKQKIK